MNKTFYLPYAVLCTLLLSACLGGSDNDDDAYTGNSDPSTIDASTAGQWAFMGLGGAQETGSFNPLAADASASASKQESFSAQAATRPHIPGLERVLAKHAASLSTGNKTASSGDGTGMVSTQEAVNENQTCENDGTAEITGNVEENGNQQLTVVYSDCEIAGVLADGIVTVGITNVSSDGLSFDGTFEYSDFIISGDGFKFIQNGKVSLSITGSVEQTLVLNLMVEEEIEGLSIKFENFSSRIREESGTAPTGRFSVNGRIYDSVLGYVDFKTEKVFRSSNSQVMPPDFSGTLKITGANGSHALVEVGHDSTVSFFTIKVDADNDGTYEINAVIPHELLDSDITEDLEDTDGDGMHNSWESFYKLDPANSSDANDDADSDGASNLQEYNSGYDPKSAGSTPPP